MRCKERFRSMFKRAKFEEVDHHLCHVAGAFFVSGLDDALIVSIDGFGDGSSALTMCGTGTTLKEVTRIDDRNSLGLEYLRATYHLGLGGYGAEGKTQGLAPYGEPTVYETYMNEIEITADGGLCLSDRLCGPSSELAVEGGYLNTQLLTNNFLDAYCPRRIDPEPLTDEHKNLAASIQKVLEHVVSEQCRIGAESSGQRNLVLTGGVTMNSSMNGQLLRDGSFKEIFPLPMASDRGIALGAALHYVHATLGEPRFFTLDDVFLGTQADDRAARRAMKKGGLTTFACDDICGYAAEALAKEKIVGWMQGRSEMGARALGHRSILADPRKAETKDIINQRVKHREWFRPFAPVVLNERALEYFTFPDGVANLSFMTFTVDATKAATENAPATVHVDGTSRVQTADQKTNPLFHRLIEKFATLTGVPIVLNTSFNDNNEPIVETAEDAVTTFLKTEMDILCIGNVVGTRS